MAGPRGTAARVRRRVRQPVLAFHRAGRPPDRALRGGRRARAGGRPGGPRGGGGRAAGPARRDARVHAAEPAGGVGPAAGRRLGALRRHAPDLGPGPGGLRLGARQRPLRRRGERPGDARIGGGRLPAPRRRLPRLRAAGGRVLPGAEHPGALRVRLPAGRRGNRARGTDGLPRLVRGVRRRALVRLRRAPQHTPGRPDPRRARPRRRRRGAHHRLRAGPPDPHGRLGRGGRRRLGRDGRADDGRLHLAEPDTARPRVGGRLVQRERVGPR